MVATQKTYLNLISLNLLESWSVQSLLDKKVTYNKKYELANIGDFLIKSRDIVNIEDGEEYRRVTVKIRNGGVTLRDIEKGENIGTKKQYRAKAGQFIVSKIDARNGAFGIIPSELDGAVVTNDFPLFTVNEKAILSQFLVLITTTKEFIKFAQSCSSGTTNRQRMDIDLFLQQKIPLPSLQEQERIVTAYQTKIQEAKFLDDKVIQLNSELEMFILTELGIEKTETVDSKMGLQLFNFSDFDRWDVWVNKGLSQTKKYQTVKFGTFVNGKPEYGANIKGVKRKSETRYIRITDINENGTLNDDFVSPEYVDEKFLLKNNDFLIARSGNTVGKTFLYKEIFGRAIYAGYLVRYNINTNLVIPEYLLEYTKSYSFKKWIESNQRIAGQPNINGQEYLLAPIVLPPIQIQEKIIAESKRIKNEIYSFIEKSRSLNEIAFIEFEQEIFGLS